MNNKKKLRKNNVSVRLKRLVLLREKNVPQWVIKSEQIALFLNSKGMKHYGIGRDFSKTQEMLYVKYVKPLLDKEDDYE